VWTRELHVQPLKFVLTRLHESLIPGLWLEFGVAEGKSLQFIASHVPQHGPKITNQVVYGFDSFEGLPEDWRPGFDKGHFERTDGAVPTFAPYTEESMVLVKGWFQEVLPPWLAEEDHAGPVSLLHIDSDIYSSASLIISRLILEARIVEGTVIIFDELFNYSGFECGESRALFEIMTLLDLQFEWVGCRERCAMPVAIIMRETPVISHLDSPVKDLLEAMAAGTAVPSFSRAVVRAASGEAAPRSNDSKAEPICHGQQVNQLLRYSSQESQAQPKPARAMPSVFLEGARVSMVAASTPDQKADRKEEVGASGDTLPEAMARMVAAELLELDLPVEASPEDVRHLLEGYQITTQMMKSFNYQMMTKNKGKPQPDRIHGRVGKCLRLMDLYEKLIETVIGPHLVAAFEAECPAGEDVDPDSRVVLYQFPPTVRIYRTSASAPQEESSSSSAAQPSSLPSQPLRTLTRMHTDREFGHQDGEVNFWMPFTTIDETSTLWAETRPDKGDWYPFFPLDVGEAWRFPGTSCRHFTKPNTSGKTRMSLDFRCSVASCYDEKWKMWGDSTRHVMRPMTIH
jgi:hypothetical protein